MQSFTGSVVSTKSAKTATVLVRRRYAHPLYLKSVNVTRKYHVHDEIGVAEGDTVRFIPCRPMSKTKRWKVVEVISKAAPTEASAKAEAAQEQVVKETSKATKVEKTEKKTAKAAPKKAAAEKKPAVKKATTKKKTTK